ncbi:hypothetical protein H072_6930 [Dactylellina haptotyla CBS 200.50]|uniref:Xylanolytic transcriptional activator regulatory domain-containing protein n=1 Tax=Dactylellina haptotyla (strain CBS 200.50) TaxID=1284197 RepID=S8BVF7_DACHA|nr:hypothetical protein H072_6930 [Dactylellina haptotyla CBS 200.50]
MPVIVGRNYRHGVRASSPGMPHSAKIFTRPEAHSNAFSTRGSVPASPVGPLRNGRRPICLSCTRLDYTCVYQPRSNTKSPRQASQSDISSNIERSPLVNVTTPENPLLSPPIAQISPPRPVSAAAKSVHDMDPMDTDSVPTTYNNNCFQPDEPQNERVFGLPPFENDFFTNFPFEQFLAPGQLGDFTHFDPPTWLLPAPEVHLGWESVDSSTPPFSTTSYSTSTTPLTMSSDGQKAATITFILPTNEEVHYLRDAFFTRFHPILPMIHRKSFLSKLEEWQRFFDDDVVLLAVMAIASCGHHEPSMREKGEGWLNRAKTFVEKAIVSGTTSIQHVQAGIWITFHMFLKADMSESWVYLGKTWRMACPLSLNRIDAKRRGHNTHAGNPDNARSLEETRRTMWGLFMIDRCLSFLCGWPFAIDDRQFMINIPVTEKIYQDANAELLLGITPRHFPSSLDKMIEPIDHCYGHICNATVLLGRIVDYNNLPAGDDGSESGRRAFDALEVALARLLLSIPTHYTQITCLQTAVEQEHTCFLICLLQTCSILLHHPTVQAVTRQELSLNEGQTPSPEFLRCLASTKRIVSAIKDLVTISNRTLSNPLAGPIFFLTGRILIIHWLETKDACTRSEIDLILLSLDKMKEGEPMALRYKRVLLFDLTRSSAAVKDIKTNDGSYVSSKPSADINE